MTITVTSGFVERVQPFLVMHTCGHYEIRLMREATAGMPWTPDAIVKAGNQCRVCRNEADPHVAPDRLHGRDTQCSIDPATDGCLVCGVDFSALCPQCRGRGFHFPGCPDSDEGK